MLTIFIGVCALVWLVCSARNGEWGTFAIGAVILVLLIFMASDDRKNTKAWTNIRDYWADGGPGRRRR